MNQTEKDVDELICEWGNSGFPVLRYKIKHTGLPDPYGLSKMTQEELQRAQDEFIVRNAERIERLKKEAEARLSAGGEEKKDE